ncbi:MAG: hypothetical protein WB502_05600 [Thermoactinomyces sp.]
MPGLAGTGYVLLQAVRTKPFLLPLLNQLESVNLVPAVISLLLILTVSLALSIWVYE